MGNFVPKTPFDLTQFLSKPGKPKTSRYGFRGTAFAKPQPEPEEKAEPVTEPPPS